MRTVFVGAAVLLAICCTEAFGKVGYGPGEQDWGFVDVRKGAHMFYWLYYTTADVKNYTERPLAIWLQGGPGGSSTGFGNFKEFGPLDLSGNYRNFTWVKDMNVLFIDNPVGSGFSYVDSLSDLTTNNTAIAKDLVAFMKSFYQLHPEFETVPLHIFCESYGGKMVPEFALELHYAIKRGEVRSNFSSIVLGDGFTSPIDSVMARAPLLLQMGIVDHDGHDNIMKEANKMQELVDAGKWKEAFNQSSETVHVLLRESRGVDLYNILKPTRGDVYRKLLLRTASSPELMMRTLLQYGIDENRDKMLQDLMRGPVSKALSIPDEVKWGSQKDDTYFKLLGDMMKPVVHIVRELLDHTSLQVGILSGHLDLICATPGTINWINKMEWSYKSEYEAAARVGITVNGILEGYEKSAGNFAMFWVNRAGHMVPADNPAAMSHILRYYTNFG